MGLKVDLHYYLSQQIHPVISRFSVADRANRRRDDGRKCPGLDSNKFKSQARGADDDFDDTFGGGAFAMDDDERFADCEPLTLKTRSGEEFDFCGVRAILDGKVRVEDALAPSTPDVGKENTPVSQGKAAMIPTNSLDEATLSNQVILALPLNASKSFTPRHAIQRRRRESGIAQRHPSNASHR